MILYTQFFYSTKNSNFCIFNYNRQQFCAPEVTRFDILCSICKGLNIKIKTCGIHQFWFQQYLDKICYCCCNCGPKLKFLPQKEDILHIIIEEPA